MKKNHAAIAEITIFIARCAGFTYGEPETKEGAGTAKPCEACDTAGSPDLSHSQKGIE